MMDLWKDATVMKSTLFIMTSLLGCYNLSLVYAHQDSLQAAAIVELARGAMTTHHLKAVIVRVTMDGEEIVTKALGESITGMPATEDMHFRNGAVAISYMSTLLLQLVDQNVVSLDDKLSNWLPDLPNADQVTLRNRLKLASLRLEYSNPVATGTIRTPTT